MYHLNWLNCRGNFSFYRMINSIWEDRDSNNRALHRMCSLMRKMGAKTVVIEDLNLDDDEEIKEEYISLRDSIADIGHDEVTRIFKKFSHNFDFYSIKKITFINKEINENIKELVKFQEVIDNFKDNDFLGYAIIINAKWTYIAEPDDSNESNLYLKKSYILRAVVQTPFNICQGICDEVQNDYIECISGRIPVYNTYYHVAREFACAIGNKNKTIKSYKLKGTYFSQQNGITSVCAHSALKMLLNNMQDGSQNGLITTAEVNNKIESKLTTGKINIKKQDIENFLKNLKYKTIYRDFFNEPNLSYCNFLHILIESSCPCLLLFTTNDSQHIVPIIGHTLNPDIWNPEAEIYYGMRNIHNDFSSIPIYNDISEQDREKLRKFSPASKWIDNLIIHDDNFGMYLSVPVGVLERNTIPILDPTFRVCGVIGLMPDNINITGMEAEQASKYLANKILRQYKKDDWEDNFWIKYLYEKNSAPFVVRTALMSRERYQKHLGYKLENRHKDSEGRQFTDKEIEDITSHLPDIFWVSEFSLSDIYLTNKTKIFDVIYKATTKKKNTTKKYNNGMLAFKNSLLFRFPGVAFFPDNTQKKLKSLEISIRGHYPLFRVKN